MKTDLLTTFYGNDKAKATLATECSGGRLPHAVLLEGESGCGKKTFARLIAAAALCTGDEPPCGLCRHCAKVLAGSHPDVTLLDGAVSAKNLNVDAVRAVRAEAYIRPNEAMRRVFILADAQNMTPQAQNALLKVLEEPPGGVMFILTCESRSLLLETILSRTVLLRLENPPEEICAQALRTLVPGREETAYALAAQVYGGNIGRAAQSFEDEAFLRVVQTADDAAHAIARGTEYDLLRALSPLEGDRDALAACLRRLRALFSAAMRRRYTGAAETQDFLVQAVPALHNARILAIIDEALRLLGQNMGWPLASTWFCAQVKSALEA